MHLSFSNRIILSIVFIQVVMFTFLIARNVNLIQESHTDLLESRSIEQSAIIATALSTGLVAHDYSMIEDVMALLKEDPELVYIIVYDRDGKLLSSVGDISNHIHPTLYLDSSDSDNNIEYTQHLQVVTRLWDNVFNVDRNIMVAGQNVGSMHVGYTASYLDEITAALQNQNTVIAIITLVFMILATAIIGFFLTAKFRMLKDGVNAIRNGDLGYKIQISSQDEMGQLAHAFNLMAEHLCNTQEELEREHKELLQQTERIDTLLNSVDAVIWESDCTLSRFTFVSHEAEQLLGLPLHDWLGDDFLNSRIASEDKELFISTIEQLSFASDQVTVDLRLINRENKPVWTRIIASSANIDEEHCKIARGLIIDINQEKLRDERMMFLAKHDALTGLVNRTQFQQRLDHHIAYSRRYKHNNALLFVDIDRFKYINDTFGHSVGDLYLIEVVERIKNTLRDTDIFGRLGGDEFAIVLPYASEEEAEVVSENLLSALNDRVWHHEGGGYTYQCKYRNCYV